MKKLICNSLLALAACAGALFVSAPLVVPAHAADTTTQRATEYAVIFQGIDDATAASANSTTTYADVPGVTWALPIINKPYANQFIQVCFNGDVTKSTATSGIIGVYVNGAVAAASERQVQSASGRTVIAGCFAVARSSAAAQTVKLQFKSGDTNAFTINNLQSEIKVLYVP